MTLSRWLFSVSSGLESAPSARTVIVPWTDLLATSGGTYSGTFDVPQGGWYRVVVRGLDERGNALARAAGAHRWGVGMNILCIRQSLRQVAVSDAVEHGTRRFESDASARTDD